jgi:thermitase
MASIRYQAFGSLKSFVLQPLSAAEEFEALAPARRAGRNAAKPRAESASGIEFSPSAFLSSLRQSETLRQRLPSDDSSTLAIVQDGRASRSNARASAFSRGSMTLMTPSIIVEGVKRADIEAARNSGARIIDEGFDGKALLGVDSIDQVVAICELLRGRDVGSVTPNFLRRFERTPRSEPQGQWAHERIGIPDAWKISRGESSVRVAVLDEGVDTSHPAIKPAVVAERDFIGGTGDSAMPNGDDAHGTACAGIIVGRGKKVPGVAPGCSLLAARIAMDDGSGHWVFEDYATADAIDWCWRHDAAVLSNSWGGGPPSDAISRAFGRARTQGRGGKGAVVCIAAGNAQRAIDFPGDLPGYVTIAASNPDDERKTRTSSDGETWWGSNYGPTLWMLAPGVFTHTTDIAGARGYDPGNYTATFNGTSSATPHVAGVAALMLSANPGLSASDVRMLLAATAVPLGSKPGWTDKLGYGRLDAGAAVAAALAHP